MVVACVVTSHAVATRPDLCSPKAWKLVKFTSIIPIADIRMKTLLFPTKQGKIMEGETLSLVNLYVGAIRSVAFFIKLYITTKYLCRSNSVVTENICVVVNGLMYISFN